MVHKLQYQLKESEEHGIQEIRLLHVPSPTLISSIGCDVGTLELAETFLLEREERGQGTREEGVGEDQAANPGLEDILCPVCER